MLIEKKKSDTQFRCITLSTILKGIAIDDSLLFSLMMLRSHHIPVAFSH